MIATKLVQLIAASSVAILLSLNAAPANALSVDNHAALAARHAHITSNLSVKKKRGTSRRCKNRAVAFSQSKKPASATKSAPTKAASKNDNNNNKNNNDEGKGKGNSGNPGSNPGAGTGPKKYNGSKVGVAFTGDESILSKIKTGKVGPLYTWSPHKPGNADRLGYKFCPMLWGHKQIDTFERLVVPGYADCILGFNEPDQAGQSNMPPEEGARLWKAHIEPKRKLGYRTISPACTNAPAGKKWLQDFLKACNGGCTLDAIAVHYYDTNAQGLIDYVNDMHNTFGRNIWITEYACQNFGGGSQCSKDQVFAFTSKVTNFLDNAGFVEAYFPFGFLRDMFNVNPLNQLIKGNGEPSDLGRAYIS